MKRLVAYSYVSNVLGVRYNTLTVNGIPNLDSAPKLSSGKLTPISDMDSFWSLKPEIKWESRLYLCTRFGITVEDLIEDVTVVAQQLNNVFFKRTLYARPEPCMIFFL